MKRRSFLRVLAGAAAAIGVPFLNKETHTRTIGTFTPTDGTLITQDGVYPIGNLEVNMGVDAGGYLVPEEVAQEVVAMLEPNTLALRRLSEAFGREMDYAFTETAKRRD